MGKFQQKMAKWMQGRYGPDVLSRDLVWIAFGIVVINIFTRIPYVSPAAFALIIISYFRIFSKNYTRRYNENRRYMNFRIKISRPLGRIWKRIKDFPKYKYFTCPECGKKMRVPRGKKNIQIKCPSCHHRFDART